LATIELDGLFKAMLIHLPNWLLLAIATALAGGLAPGRKKLQPLLASLITAAIVSAILFPILGLVIFPAEAPDRPIPYEVGLRLLCFALGGAVLGLGASRSLRSFMLDASEKA
jgi:hypothetical protein